MGIHVSFAHQIEKYGVHTIFYIRKSYVSYVFRAPVCYELHYRLNSYFDYCTYLSMLKHELTFDKQTVSYT